MGLFHFTNFAHLWQNIKVERDLAYGWEPDPQDDRNETYEFQTTWAAKASSSASSIDNSKYYKPISNQWHMPSCTANAGADYLEAVDIYDKIRSGVDIYSAVANQPDYSRMFLWWNGRNEMDPPRIHDEKSGCYNRLIMDVAARFGVPEEKYWPYNEEKLPPLNRERPVVRPSVTAYRMARPHTIERYHALLGKDDARLEQVIKALKANPGVLFGTALGEEFGSVGDKVLRIPKTTIARHAMVIVGYERSKAAFLVRNSHGLGFGIQENQELRGYFWMHESYVAWSKTKSLWVCTKGAM